MKKYISILGIFGSWIFFSANTLISGVNSNTEGSIIYKLYWTCILIISFKLFIFDSNLKKRWTRIILITPIMGSIALFLISFLIYGIKPRGNLYILTLFVAQCIPCYLLGVYCKINRYEENLFKSVQMLSIISIVVLIIGIIPLISGSAQYAMLTNVGGMSNMQIAYASMDMYIIIFMYGIMKKQIDGTLKEVGIYKYIRVPIIILLLFSIIATGTRGALIITLIIPIIVFIVSGTIKNKILMKKSLIYAFTGGFVILLIVFFLDIQMINFAIDRIMLLLKGTKSGGSWAGGSGREALYPEAINNIAEHPFIGLGPLGFINNYNTYPHNIILELMVDYGMIIGSTILVGLFLLVIKFFTISKRNYPTLIMFVVFIAEIIKMLFSSTIFSNQILWFFLGYIATFILEYDTEKL